MCGEHLVASSTSKSAKAGLRPSVVITTKNRLSDLCRAIESALSQSAKPHVLVIDDGSTDGTSDFISKTYREIQLISHDTSKGYIIRRNEAAMEVSAEIIISIDDDAVFSSPSVIEKTLSDFEEDARIAAVAIPCIDILKENCFRLPVPPDDRVYITAEYIGTAHAVRRNKFLSLGGYRESLLHQGEERDFCLRLLQAGYVVRLGTADPIHHFESPKRDLKRQDFFGRRNDVLFAFHNVPLKSLPLHLTGTITNGVKFGLRCGRTKQMAEGLMRGMIDGVKEWPSRSAVRGDVYQLSRMLRKKQFVTLDDIAMTLSRLRTQSTTETT